MSVGVLAAAAMLFAVGCNDGDAIFAPPANGVEGGGVVGISSNAPTLLRSPESCDDLVAEFREFGLDTLLGYRGFVTYDVAMGAGNESVTADASTAASVAAPDRGASSDTNTQEAGIDEPDLVETDGDYVYALAPTVEGEELVILDGATAEVVGRVDLGAWGNSMLLSGDRLLVISQGGYGGYMGPAPLPEVMPVDLAEPSSSPPAPGSAGDVAPPETTEPVEPSEPIEPPRPIEPVEPSEPIEPPRPIEPVEPSEPIEPPGFNVGTTIQLIDVSDRSTPTIVETTEVEGVHNTTRVVDGVARIVISSYPEIYPAETSSGDFEDAMRDAISDAEIDDWLPEYQTVTGDEGARSVSDRGRLVDCDQVLVPDVYAGIGETSILRVDFHEGFDPADTTTVVADAGTVYASPDTLYIAARRWNAGGVSDLPTPDVTTAVHAFDLSGDGAAVHVAAGEVLGSVLNQYSMSEYDGDLRIATTQGDFGNSQSGVRVLRRNGESFDEIGAVTGLGPTETIQSVRFVGDSAYVVTFRQTDPLYVVDLSDPTDPEAVGEIKIPGFSSYLHPIGGDLVVGVGRNADNQGIDTGFLVSVFDVSDPTAPIQVDTFTDPGMYSPAGLDPKAFLWWEDEGVVVVPFEHHDSVFIGVPSDDGPVVQSPIVGDAPSGLLVLDVGDDGIGERGRVQIDADADVTHWSRGLVVQDALWGLYTTMSDSSLGSGVAVADFDDLTAATVHPFG